MASVGVEVAKPMVWNFRYHFPNLFMKTFMYGVVGSLAMFITSWDSADRMKDRFLLKNREYGDTFDFIVVGGGTAGSVVAARLSKEYKVLLLEAGGDPHPFQAIPFMANFISSYPELDWMHNTTPQKHALFGSEENRGRISGGKGLGGSSNLDYMMYLRGHPRDYDNWASITGDPSWGYESIQKYFMRHEKYEGHWKDKNKGHGSQGEMRLSKQPYSTMADRFVVAGNEMGYGHVDLNSIYDEGFDMMVSPMTSGHRHMAYNSFLKGDKWNLVVHKYSHVNKILTRGEGNDAYAVEYHRHGKTRYAYARKEIILSAGAINSPKILMLSGIGDSTHLQATGIPAKVHLPAVGNNLQDHMAVYLGPFMTTPLQTLLIDRDLSPMSFVSYTMGQGPLTTTGYEATAMLTSDLTKASPNTNPHWPDIQLIMKSVALHSTADEDLAHATRLRRSLLTKYYEGSKNKDSFSILVSATRPLSRGQVKLVDNNPYSPPLIDPNYLEREEDVGVIVDGIKKTLRMVENTLKFQQISASLTNQSVEGCENYKPRSDEYWACFVRVMGVSMGDVVGTVGIGGAVNSQLQVLGTHRLRVIDSSVMPTIVSGGTGAATLMIGEKGADMILKYWGLADKSSLIAKESKEVKSILTKSATKLREMDSSSLFMNHMKATPTFKELSLQEQNSALEKSKNLTGTSGWANLFRPLHDFTGLWSTFNNVRLFDPNSPHNKPLSVVGTMFKNSLTNAGEVKTTTPTPITPPTIALPSLFLTSLLPPPLPTSDLVSALFDYSAPATPPDYKQRYPQTPPGMYVLTPKSTPTPYPQVTTKKTFSSSVDAFVEKYHPLPSSYNHSPRFSQTLPILGFASVDKTKLSGDKYSDSDSSHSMEFPSFVSAPDLDSHISKFLRPNWVESSTSSTLKALLGAPLKYAAAPFKLVTKAFEPLHKSLTSNFHFKPLDNFIKSFASPVNTTVSPSIRKKPLKLTPTPEKGLRGEVDKFLYPKETDYAFMEEQEPSTLPFRASLYSPSSMPLGEIIYKAPFRGLGKSNMASLGLADNVQGILQESHPLLISEKSPAYRISIENDPKSLEEEVNKLISKPIYFYPIHNSPLLTQAQEQLPFTKIIHKILENHARSKSIVITPTSNYLSPDPSSGVIKSSFRELWPTPKPAANENMSFRIKILKQK